MKTLAVASWRLGANDLRAFAGKREKQKRWHFPPLRTHDPFELTECRFKREETEKRGVHGTPTGEATIARA